MTTDESRIASRALRYIVCEGMESIDAVVRALDDYADLPGPIDMRVIERAIANAQRHGDS